MTAQSPIQRTLGPIVYTVRELPADFYGDRFYVQGKRTVTTGDREGVLSWFCGSYWRTFEQADRSRLAWQAEADASPNATEPVEPRGGEISVFERGDPALLPMSAAQPKLESRADLHLTETRQEKEGLAAEAAVPGQSPGHPQKATEESA